MLIAFSGKWYFDEFYSPEGEASSQEYVLDRLRVAMKAGEIINITYLGGSTPGRKRDLCPRKFIKDFELVQCFCLDSEKIKSFKVKRFIVHPHEFDNDYFDQYSHFTINEAFDHFMLNQRFSTLKFRFYSGSLEVYENRSSAFPMVRIGQVQKGLKDCFLIETNDHILEFTDAATAFRFLIHMVSTADFKISNPKRKKKTA